MFNLIVADPPWKYNNVAMMSETWIYDLETYPNVFTAAFEHADMPFKLAFEISDFRNDSQELAAFLNHLRNDNARLVGFNNIGFDYPILHQFIRMGRGDAATLYAKAQAIIGSQNKENGRWAHSVKPSEHFVKQIDLYKIHHFDNRAKATGLKVLEFAMRSDSIQDLPFPFTSILDQEQVKVLKRYNAHDVSQTKKFYHHTLPMIRFREELSLKYNRDFLNHNDTAIGKTYFQMKLEEAGVACYEYGENGRTPRQTKRPVIHLRDCILPWITFDHPELTRVLDWFKQQRITETKGVFKDITAKVNGFEFVFGLGGIHGSVSSQVVESDDDHVILDLDVASYYPNLAITNNLYPAHLGETFVSIYKYLFEQRKQYPKKSAESAMLKLALNGVYGDSGNPFSIFYDPQYTMSITLNGQMLLCILAEQLAAIRGVELIQINTDGITIRAPREQLGLVGIVNDVWQAKTGLTLEDARYKLMAIRDVNNYIAVYEDGSTKRKGAYEHQVEWHQNASALVVPKVAEKVLVEGLPIRQTIEEWPDLWDFLIRVKIRKSDFLSVTYDDEKPQELQRTSRYYIAKEGGVLHKHMPPLKYNPAWRKNEVEAGWRVCVCNDMKDAVLPVDFDYYVQEVEKLVLGLA